ncbi:MAG: photosynthetic reaction center subunit H [Pseudomonadota bacterium]
MAEVLGYIDGAQIVLYAFWVFFAGLVWYLQAESRREGYPLEDDVSGSYNKDPVITLPSPKTFILPNGHGERVYPHPENRDTREIKAKRANVTSGSPLIPTGNPMKDGVGPAAWAERPDYPDAGLHGEPKIRPLSALDNFEIAKGDIDPVGQNVLTADSQIVGQISDVWVDTMENYIRFFEVKFGRNKRLIPLHFAKPQKAFRGGAPEYYVHALTAEQFRDIPKTKDADQITMLEEEKIMGYFGGGMLYATPDRAEPIL